MNILLLTHRLPYAPNRGDRLRAFHLLAYLAARHRVDLVSLVHDDEEEASAGLLAGVAASVTTARVRRWRTLPRALRSLACGQPLTHALLDAPGFHDRLTTLRRRVTPDVVLAYCSGMARFALEPPLDDLPFVLDMVDVDSEKWGELGRRGATVRHWIYRREARLLRAFEWLASTDAAATLVVNERERNSLAAIAPGARIAVVPNGIDIARSAGPRPPREEGRVVFCGVMNYEPNEAAAVWLARQVWPLVRRTRPDARLTLVGANPTRRVLDLASDPTIEVTGSVPDVKPFLWRAAVSVAPLRVARGVQNKVLEAVASGLPSVVSRQVMEGLPCEVAPACIMADGEQPFADAVVRLLALSPRERQDMVTPARLEPLGWERRLAPLDGILAGAVAARAKRTA